MDQKGKHGCIESSWFSLMAGTKTKANHMPIISNRQHICKCKEWAVTTKIQICFLTLSSITLITAASSTSLSAEKAYEAVWFCVCFPPIKLNYLWRFVVLAIIPIILYCVPLSIPFKKQVQSGLNIFFLKKSNINTDVHLHLVIHLCARTPYVHISFLVAT